MNDAFHFYRSSTAVGGHLNSYIISSIAEDRSDGSGLQVKEAGWTIMINIPNAFPFKKVYSQELSFKIVEVFIMRKSRIIFG